MTGCRMCSSGGPIILKLKATIEIIAANDMVIFLLDVALLLMIN